MCKKNLMTKNLTKIVFYIYEHKTFPSSIRFDSVMVRYRFRQIPVRYKPFQPYRPLQNIYTNSVDPDETAHEPSHQDLHYLPVN